MGRRVSTFLGWLKAAWDFLVSKFWQITTAVLVLVVAAVIVRPFDQIHDPAPEDVATAWNRSIGRLGILPLYPPTEDFAVGDVLAVVADSDNVPLLGKAVRIAHIDLRDSILSSNVAPLFADTADKGSSYRKQDRLEVQPEAANRRIALAISAFPGITITHVTESGAAAASTGGWFGSSRKGQSVEEIQIAGAETYGVPTVDAIVRLNNWCRDANTKAYCDDSFARQALAFAVSDRVLATKSKDGDQKVETKSKAETAAYATRLQLQLVTRVYLTREIIQRRLDEGAGGAAIQALANPSQVVPPGQPSGKPVDPGGSNPMSNVAEVDKGLAASGTPGARISVVRSDGVDLGLRATFQRPVAFGYRAVTVALEPAVPGKDRVP